MTATRDDMGPCHRCNGTGWWNHRRGLECFECKGEGIAPTFAARRIRNAERRDESARVQRDERCSPSDIAVGGTFAGKVVAAIIDGPRWTVVADDGTYQRVNPTRDRIRTTDRWREAREGSRLARTVAEIIG